MESISVKVNGHSVEWSKSSCFKFKSQVRIPPQHLVIIIHIFLYILCFFFFYPVCDGKDGKTCLNDEKDDFDQQTAYEAPICWSKYTTL